MSIVVIGQVQTKRDTTANWLYVNPVLKLGEIGLDTTVNNFKVGDGVIVWSSLPYWLKSGTTIHSITGGATSNPLIVTYPGATAPPVLKVYADGHYGDNAGVVFGSGEIIYTGDDNGFGQFADTQTFIINP